MNISNTLSKFQLWKPWSIIKKRRRNSEQFTIQNNTNKGWAGGSEKGDPGGKSCKKKGWSKERNSCKKKQHNFICKFLNQVFKTVFDIFRTIKKWRTNVSNGNSWAPSCQLAVQSYSSAFWHFSARKLWHTIQAYSANISCQFWAPLTLAKLIFYN